MTSLLFLGAALGGGNIWFAAARSTIPLHVDGVVAHKELRLEKKVGVDDVPMLQMDAGRWIQVDRAVYELISEGSRLSKRAWSHSLRVDAADADLAWSRDSRRLAVVMPLSGLIMLLTWFSIRSQPREPD